MTTDLLKSPVDKVLLQHTVSNVSGNVIMVSRNLLDGFYAAQISTIAMAAFTLVMPMIFLLIGLSLSLSIVAGNLIARAKGETGQLPGQLIVNVLISTLMMSVIGATLLGLMVPTLFQGYGAEALVTGRAIELAFWLVMGMPFLFTYGTLTAILRALGEPQYVIKATVSGLLIGAVITPILIFVPWLDDSHKLLAIAIGLNISYFITSLILIRRLRVLKAFAPLVKLALFIADCKHIFRQAIPVLLNNLLTLGAIFAVTLVVSQSGTDALAAFGVVSRFEQFALICINGVVLSVVPLVGQNFGAKQLDRVSLSVKYALLYVLIISVVIGTVIVLFAPQLAELFNLEGYTKDYAQLWFYLIACSLFFQGISMMGISLLQVLSRSKLAMWLTCLRLYVIMIPALMVMRYVADVEYIYFAISLSHILSGVAFVTAMLILIKRYQHHNGEQSSDQVKI